MGVILYFFDWANKPIIVFFILLNHSFPQQILDGCHSGLTFSTILI